MHLVDLPQMLHDAVRDALAGAAFELAMGPPPPGPAPGVTVLVMPARVEPGLWIEQLTRRPDASILLIEPRDCEAALVELRPERRYLGILDAPRIADAIRSASAWEARVTAAVTTK
ncbi:MAG: hypothetical protein QOE44_2357 [Solirubrobacteraceae bacterium]|nr:hypothetical protein [Solirubrobacteraceae bacterium]